MHESFVPMTPAQLRDWAEPRETLLQASVLGLLDEMDKMRKNAARLLADQAATLILKEQIVSLEIATRAYEAEHDRLRGIINKMVPSPWEESSEAR